MTYTCRYLVYSAYYVDQVKNVEADDLTVLLLPRRDGNLTAIDTYGSKKGMIQNLSNRTPSFKYFSF